MLANFTIPNGVILLRSLAAQASLPACRASAAGGKLPIIGFLKGSHNKLLVIWR
jgi:hypothetical protein